MTQKRGGGAAVWSLDQIAENWAWEPPDPAEPCPEFDQEWAARTLRTAFAGVEQRWVERGRATEFATYSRFLPGSTEIPTYACVASELQVTEFAARTAVSRLRLELAEALRAEVDVSVIHPKHSNRNSPISAVLSQGWVPESNQPGLPLPVAAIAGGRRGKERVSAT